jgi:hypothetical protein
MSDLPGIVRLDQPESPDRTRDLGNLLAATAKALNYATRGDCPGLGDPSDAYSLLAALYTATQRLPQLLGQVASFVTAQAAAGTVADANGKIPVQVAAIHAAWLADAQALAADLTGHLQGAQNAISGLYVKDGSDE